MASNCEGDHGASYGVLPHGPGRALSRQEKEEDAKEPRELVKAKGRVRVRLRTTLGDLPVLAEVRVPA